MLLNLEKLISFYKLDIKGVLHIGANKGQEYPLYKKLKINPIIFIEALPSIYSELIKNAGSECILLNNTLSDIEEELEMFTECGTEYGSSSILEPNLHEVYYPHINLRDKTIIKTSLLDSLNIPQVNFINIDVQGAELKVFKGGIEYLKNVDYIITEVNKEELYKNCVLVEELDSYLNGYGFVRLDTNWAGKGWGDAFYLKKK